MANRNTWTPLLHHAGHEINSRGDVRHIRSRTQLKTSVNQFGLRYVSIRNTTTNKYENKPLNVLVAETFVPNDHPDIHTTVLHLNGDQTDVNAENLRWTSRWHAIGYHKEIVEEHWFRSRRVVLDGPQPQTFRSIGEAAMATTCLPSSIDYALQYNKHMALNEDLNFVQRVDPGGLVFRD